MKEYLDIVFKETPARQLMMDISVPEGPPPSVVMFIHGGGFNYGNRKDCRITWIREKGYAVASIEYRLRGQGTMEDMILDCKDALAYIKQNAQRYGYDADKVIVAGDSAGGHLASLLTTSRGQSDWEQAGVDYSVQAAVVYYAPVDVFPSVALRDTDENIYMDELLEVAPGDALGRAKAARYNAVTYIDGSEPPFLLVHGDEDKTVAFSQSITLRDALEKVDVPVSLHRVQGGWHGVQSPSARLEVEEFLDYYFKR